ncbi:MAG: hypothetical protein RL198_204 [Actinomycetota bacterium]
MSELALFLVRIGFVAVLWIFILSLLSVIRADIYGRRVVSRLAQQNAPQLAANFQAAASKQLGVELEEVEGSEPTHLLFTSGKGSGGQVMLDKRELVIGRAPNCDVPIADEFASSMHAKLVRVGDDWVLQDLNSTNGTFLDGRKVSTPAVVKRNVPIRVGNTSFELRS